MFIHTRGIAHSYLHTPSRLGSNISPALILFSDKQGFTCRIPQRCEDFGMECTRHNKTGEGSPHSDRICFVARTSRHSCLFVFSFVPLGNQITGSGIAFDTRQARCREQGPINHCANSNAQAAFYPSHFSRLSPPPQHLVPELKRETGEEGAAE